MKSIAEELAISFLKLREVSSLQKQPPKVFLEKSVLKMCSKITVGHPCQSVISTKLRNFIEITLQHGCPPVNLLHIFGIPFRNNTSGRLLLSLYIERY